MTKESTLPTYLESTSNETAVDRNNLTLEVAERLTFRMTESENRYRTEESQNPAKCGLRQLSNRWAELASHLLNVSCACSYEMRRYLDMLSFRGKAYADEVAAEQHWEIDHEIVERYRAGMRDIAAKYDAPERAKDART